MEAKEWMPADLLQLSGGYWGTCALHAGVKLDLFTPLADRSLTSTELANLLDMSPRGLTMLLDALAALGLLEKKGEAFVTTPSAVRFLSRTSPDYLGHIILHHHHLMSGWAHLHEAVATGRPLRERVSHGDNESVRESFLLGMFNLAMLLAPRIVTQIDLAGRRRLLDLGGGPGTYAIHFCKQNPELTAVIYDLPTTRRFAEQTIARFGLTERIGFMDGDFIEKGVEGHFDVAWLSHILHGEGPHGCAVILEKAVGALEPGGLLLVQEFILENTRDRPLFPALFSLNMLVGTTEGQAYSEGEIMAMMAAAGLTALERLPVELPNGAGIIAGTLPG